MMEKHILLAIALASGVVAASAAQIPRPAPELTINGSSGQTFQLSQFKGKVVVVEILSTTCSHCQNSARVLSKVNAELGAKGFQPVGMAINDNPNVGEFIRSFGVNFPVGVGKRDDAFAFLQHSVMSSFYFPQMVFIDRKGMIRAQYGGNDAFVQNNEEANVRNMVNQLLNESGPAASKAKMVTSSRKKAAS